MVNISYLLSVAVAFREHLFLLTIQGDSSVKDRMCCLLATVTVSLSRVIVSSPLTLLPVPVESCAS